MLAIAGGVILGVLGLCVIYAILKPTGLSNPYQHPNPQSKLVSSTEHPEVQYSCISLIVLFVVVPLVVLGLLIFFLRLY
jgi:hypothetical protein